VSAIREELEERTASTTRENIGLVLPLLAVTFLGLGALAVAAMYRN